MVRCTRKHEVIMSYPAVKQATTRMDEVIVRVSEEFQKIHTGRANPSLVEHVMVMSYGQATPLKAVGSITVPEPNQIAITPWDKDQLGAIDTAIREAGLGLNPTNDGNAVRITLPPLTQERRQELIKQVGKIAEEGRIALRDQRHEAVEAVRGDQAATEDDRFQAVKQLDELIATYNGKIESLVKAKEQELMTV